MKTITFLLFFLISTTSLIAQKNHQKYDALIRKADSLYQVKDNHNSALAFSDALIQLMLKYQWTIVIMPLVPGFGKLSWQRLLSLNYVATKWITRIIGHLKEDPDFKSLYSDKRWQSIIELVKANKDITYSNIDFITINGFKVEILTSGMQNNKAK